MNCDELYWHIRDRIDLLDNKELQELLQDMLKLIVGLLSYR